MSSEDDKNESSSESSAQKPTLPKVKLPIVCLGASAGGLEALEEFFQHTPVDSGLAFVVIQHLSPTHVSMLTEILQRTTTMSVIEVQDNMQVQSNTVYIIPPNRDMSILHGKLQLSIPEKPHGQNLPIDFLCVH